MPSPKASFDDESSGHEVSRFHHLLSLLHMQHLHEISELQVRVHELTSKRDAWQSPSLAIQRHPAFAEQERPSPQPICTDVGTEDANAEHPLAGDAVTQRELSSDAHPSAQPLEEPAAAEACSVSEKLKAALKAEAREEATSSIFSARSGTFGSDLPDDEEEKARDTAEIAQTQSSGSACTCLENFLQSHSFESMVSVLLILNVVFMASELQYVGLITGYELGKYDNPPPEESRPALEEFFFQGDKVFTILFAIDVSVRILVLRCRFWRVMMNWIDALVVGTSVIEFFYSSSESKDLTISPVYLRLLRLGKLARALKMITMSKSLESLQLLLKCVASSVDMLFWSFCLLTFIQCVAGMIVSNLARGYLEDVTAPLATRQGIFEYYGTFSRTFLTMFEVLFANWSPPCRILVENVSEAFSIFFLIYRCIISFAVLNVVNAVFVQQTMRVANADEDLAFKQKQKDIARYTRKVKKLFMSVDTSEDGEITMDEFAKLVESPKLKFWVSQLELEYHDLLGLFEMLDDGDGKISLQEFVEGASRLKGPAKAIDMYRVETKLELLLAKILTIMASNPSSPVADKSMSLGHMFKAAGISRERTSFQRALDAAGLNT
eukprot:gb/GFBE01025975.1/.p1 GENE.gb/GFBE01025975.1/~~gb/GFBE01025975.1/.p1  ORF type:complete len:609 (+),score=145.19 gb/GFBE01025975.1/:1-1827(+)